MDPEKEMQTTIDTVIETFGKFEAEMSLIDTMATKISKRTNRLIRVVLTILAGSGAMILLMVVNLTDNMSMMIESMNTMYNHFGLMSKNMHAITGSVINMGQNIEGIPAIAGSMQQMNGDVKGMNSSVVSMIHPIQSMEQNIGRINGGVWEMSGRFHSVTGAVNHMNYDVNQMSRPTDMVSPLGWMTPP
ncbi:MAG: hypothetical protein HQL80_13430 [Magnetococcales bacterium]|nr:hypothetical protein [Magnetococcales bacterium]